MTTIDLVNDVFDKYYHKDFLPSKIGGSPETNIVRFLIAINHTIQIEQKKAEITEKWISDTVTWYTERLPLLLLITKFPDETHEEYLNRIYDMTDAQQSGGNSNDTIRYVIYALIKTAINNPDNDINFLSFSSFNEWKDQAEGPDAYWGQGYLWAETSELLNATVKIQIQFVASGSSSDPTKYEYWALSQNYTKIQDVVKLFKTPGITFELELLSP